MKNLILGALFLTMFNINADMIEATVDDIVCAEINPFIIGDACILFSTEISTGNKLGLVYPDYDLFDVAEEAGYFYLDRGDANGTVFTATNCSYFTSGEDISELKSYNSQYFYLSCDLNGLSFEK